ncbi:hypothetical protein EI94DRAFT_1708499 [Lactarius quietus]|nr:hypothetical protein EI94DRAFT_1708499 [Lactarius quietus]
MSQVPSTSISSTDFETIFRAALEEYQSRTKKDIASNPLATQVFPLANAIFAGIGVLLQTVQDVRAGKDALLDLFSRIEYFFKRLEKYPHVRPSAAMKSIIVEIMVEVLSILGIVRKEIKQGRTTARQIDARGGPDGSSGSPGYHSQHLRQGGWRG